MAREFTVTMIDNNTYNQAKKDIMEEILELKDTPSTQLVSSSRSKMKKTLCIFSKLMTKN